MELHSHHLILDVIASLGSLAFCLGSVISGTVGAVLGAKSARETNAANLAAARETNDLNLQMFDRARGAYGNSLLPDYFGKFEGQQLMTDTENYYAATKAALGDPWQQEFRYRTLRNQFTPQFNAANQTAADIWNGNITQERLNNLYKAPATAKGGGQQLTALSGASPRYSPDQRQLMSVAEARLNVPAQQRQAIQQSLQKTLNEIKSINTRQGFTGDSSFLQNRLFGARLGAGEQAAAAESQAILANANDARAIADSGIQLRLSNMDLPYQRAQQAIAFEQLPVEIMQTNQGRALRPFDFFRLGQTPFRYDQLPQGQSVPSAGQIALTGIGAANQQAGSYLLQRDLANRYAANPYANNNAQTGIDQNLAYSRLGAAGAYSYPDYVTNSGIDFGITDY